MSKMGRYVYQLQEQEENPNVEEQYDQNRKGHSDTATHPLTRLTISCYGGQRVISRPRLARRSATCPSVTPTSGAVPKATPTKKV